MQQRNHKRSGSAAMIMGLCLFALAWSISACNAQAPAHKRKPQAGQATDGTPPAKKDLPNKPGLVPDMAFLYQLPSAWTIEFYGDIPYALWEKPDLYPPPSFWWWHYSCATYVDAAIRLQALGKEKACQDLLQLAHWEDNQHSGYRAIVLCRMLFVARKGQEFRRALTGGATFIGGTTSSDWPLEPIVSIDQLPFIISLEDGELGGVAESASGYVRYCIKNCNWSTTKYHRLTQKQQEQALQKLYALPVWQRQLTNNLKAFFAHQISPMTKRTEDKNK